MSDDDDGVNNHHNFDELVGQNPTEINVKPHHNNIPGSDQTPDGIPPNRVSSQVESGIELENNETDLNVRRINLILDPSAFTRGIGNIKRWYTDEYIKGVNQKVLNAHTIVNLYIPSYTLHEFEYLKKGTSMIATYARQSIKFIDQLFEHNMTTKEVTSNFTINMSIEAPHERGPHWNKCKNYQIHQPKIKEFPNFKTKFDSTLIGERPETYGELSDQFDSRLAYHFNGKLNDIQYENSKSYLEAAANAENFAIMPARLKYLISSCIYKRFIEQHQVNDPLQEWKCITEDSVTNVWVSSYGIDCMNVNEAELLLFQSYDINKLYNPHKSFSLEDEVHHNSILQNTIDTSLYTYRELDQPNKGKPRGKKGKTTKSNKLKQQLEQNPSQSVPGVANETRSDLNGETITVERFDSINYAPRGEGELWKPS